MVLKRTTFMELGKTLSDNDLLTVFVIGLIRIC